MEATEEQIQEYESQLADVQELLKASPDDAALLSLKKDLEELLALTKSTTIIESTSVPQESLATEAAAVSKTESALETSAAELPKKKKLKIKDFEIPEHLKPKEGDTEAETNRKKRAVKKLKNKWREKKKEVESTKKQQSWQSFQSKAKRKDKTSIFATQEGSNARVGVISANNMTEFGARKRHKHS